MPISQAKVIPPRGHSVIDKLFRARTAATVVVTLMLTAGVAVAATSGGSHPTFAQEDTSTSVGVDDSTTSSAVSDSTTTSLLDESTTTSTSTDESTTSTSVDQATTTTQAGGSGTGDFKNHGDCVSQAAHDTPPGPGHGQAVSEVAKSDCGKTTASTDDTEAPETSEPSSSGHRNSGGNGHGKGHSGS